MSDIPERLRREVVARANDHCEYCRLPQEGQEAAFHIDHVVPRKANGPTTFDNLALACVSCSLRKAAKLTGVDPETGRECRLFDPRNEVWSEHFQWQESRIVGRTEMGRATIGALNLNRPSILDIREEQIWLGRFPPDRDIETL